MLIKIKKGFTLIEILIVIVIIGILSVSILPKIIGATSKARDTKRLADLRNISTAVELYYAEHKQLPLLESCNGNKCGSCTVFGDVSRLKNKLSSYLTEIPEDPQKNSFVKMHYVLHSLDFGKMIEWFGQDLRGGKVQSPGQYLYQIFNYKGNNFGAAVLVSKVENVANANYVLKKNRKSIGGRYLPSKNTAGGARKIPSIRFDGLDSCWDKTTNNLEDLKLCNQVLESKEVESREPSSEEKKQCEQEKEKCTQERVQCKNDCENEKKECKQNFEQKKSKCKKFCENEKQQCEQKKQQCENEKQQCKQNKRKCKDQCSGLGFFRCRKECNEKWNCKRPDNCPISCLGCSKTCSIIPNCLGCSKTCPICIRNCSIEHVISEIGEAIDIEKEPKNRCVYTPNDELYYVKIIR